MRIYNYFNIKFPSAELAGSNVIQSSTHPPQEYRKFPISDIL